MVDFAVNYYLNLSSLEFDANLLLDIHFVDTEEIKSLNERFMGKSKPTDVLSFPVDDLSEISTLPALLGDIFICPEIASANPAHNDLENELKLLLVHGILHIFGMDHEIDLEAEEMESLESEILSFFDAQIKNR